MAVESAYQLIVSAITEELWVGRDVELLLEVGSFARSQLDMYKSIKKQSVHGDPRPQNL